MKRFFAIALTALIMLAGCDKYDDSALLNRIKELEERVNGLENLASQLTEAQRDNVYIVSYAELENGTGWIITFSDGSTIEVTDGVNGSDGKDGADGADGKDGLDGTDGKDGEDGEDGVDGADGAKGDKGDTGAKGDKGDTGVKGDKGDSLIASIEEEGETIVITLANGEKYTFPKATTITITAQPTAPTATLVAWRIPNDVALTVAATVNKADLDLEYQWYNNSTASNTGGSAIVNATSSSYTLPVGLYEGTHYFFCRVSAADAAVRTSVVTVIVEPYLKYNDEGVEIAGVVWAARNVDAPGTFADAPEDAGMFYQWGRKVGWSAQDPMVNSDGGSTWDSAPYDGDVWLPENDPCPDGWRMPKPSEFESLDEAGSEWTTVNEVNGQRFGTEPNTIFLPATGYRTNANGALTNVGSYGDYWSDTPNSTAGGYGLNFAAGTVNPSNNYNRALGFAARCVKAE